MDLLVDIGNTRIKWVLQDSDTWNVGEPLMRQNKAFKDLARPAWKELDAPARVIVSSVAGADYDKSVRTWVKRRWKVAPEFLRAERESYGVTNAYKEPERLGADRWACLLAARAQYRGPVVVADCGTVITLDAMSGDGRHMGGLLAPGLELMSASLATRTAGIELQDTENSDIPLLGGSTEVCVAGGVLYTAAALIDRVFHEMRSELGRSTTLLLTGGDAARIQPLLSVQPVVEPDLVMKGLAFVAQKTAVEPEPEPEPESERESDKNEPDTQEKAAAEAEVCDT